MHPAVYRLTLHAYEAAALIAAARWAMEGGDEPLPAEAIEQLRQVVDSYDRALAGLGGNGSGRSLGSSAGPP